MFRREQPTPARRWGNVFARRGVEKERIDRTTEYESRFFAGFVTRVLLVILPVNFLAVLFLPMVCQYVALPVTSFLAGQKTFRGRWTENGTISEHDRDDLQAARFAGRLISSTMLRKWSSTSRRLRVIDSRQRHSKQSKHFGVARRAWP